VRGRTFSGSIARRFGAFTQETPIVAAALWIGSWSIMILLAKRLPPGLLRDATEFLPEFAIPPDRQMPRDLWRWHIDVERVADLSSGDRLPAVGLKAPGRFSGSGPSFRSSESGCGGRISGRPRTQRSSPVGRVLCLFRETDDISVAMPLRPPITYRHVPAPPKGMTT